LFIEQYLQGFLDLHCGSWLSDGHASFWSYKSSSVIGYLHKVPEQPNFQSSFP
jgi:hypothetical protein